MFILIVLLLVKKVLEFFYIFISLFIHYVSRAIVYGKLSMLFFKEKYNSFINILLGFFYYIGLGIFCIQYVFKVFYFY